MDRGCCVDGMKRVTGLHSFDASMCRDPHN
jgi:hypothetical protein